MFNRLIAWLYAKTHFRPTSTHGELCELCGYRINDLHGNPAKWGTWLPSERQELPCAYYHAFCVKDHINCLKATITQLQSTRNNFE